MNWPVKSFHSSRGGISLEPGIVLKGVGGFYAVDVGKGQVITCVPRGRFKKSSLALMAGDRVHIQHDGERGTIEAIVPRKTELYRPAIANVEQVVIVASVKKPELNLSLLDRLLVLAEAGNLETLICLNKMDLIDPAEIKDVIAIYREIGYQTVPISALLSRGIEEIKEYLQGKISVLAGPSGAGKSTILNRLYPDLELKTAAISSKLKQGRHTTRHVELIPLETGGYVADTPGFSQLLLKGIAEEELPFLFPEIGRSGEGCRFKGCLHFKEPGCAVQDALQDGMLAASRHENYIRLLKEIQQEERSY